MRQRWARDSSRPTPWGLREAGWMGHPPSCGGKLGRWQGAIHRAVSSTVRRLGRSFSQLRSRGDAAWARCCSPSGTSAVTGHSKEAELGNILGAW